MPAASTSALPVPDDRVRQGRAAAQREGDARPLRVATTRCSASRRRCGARSSTSSPTSPSAADGADCPPRRGDHRAGPQVHQARATRWRCSCSRTSRPTIEVTLFPRMLREHGHKLADDAGRRREGPARPPRRGPRQADLPVGRGARRASRPARRRRSAAHPGDGARRAADRTGSSGSCATTRALAGARSTSAPRCCACPTSSASTSTAPSASCAWPSATTPSRCSGRLVPAIAGHPGLRRARRSDL